MSFHYINAIWADRVQKSKLSVEYTHVVPGSDGDVPSVLLMWLCVNINTSTFFYHFRTIGSHSSHSTADDEGGGGQGCSTHRRNTRKRRPESVERGEEMRRALWKKPGAEPQPRKFKPRKSRKRQKQLPPTLVEFKPAQTVMA